MEDKNQINPRALFGAHIKVVGVGGSGSNAINHMINSGVYGVDFIAINCDSQDLFHSKAKKKIQIGKNLTHGLGAGMDIDVGRRAAEETRDEIQETLKGADMVFITYGMGGGTGTGAAPIIAEVAKKQGALTLAVVTKPFSFEGALRAEMAEEGLENLIEAVDTVIVIPNDRLLKIVDKKTRLTNAFALCDDVLKNAVQGISELIIKPGIINLDFADIKTVMVDAGPSIMGIGQAKGDNRAIKAAKKAISSPLLDISIEGATGVLFAVSGGNDLTLPEIKEAAEIITESVDPNAKIIFGAIHDPTLDEGKIKITVIAAGFSNQGSKIITKINEDEEISKRIKPTGASIEEDLNTPAFMRKDSLKPDKYKFLEKCVDKDSDQTTRSNNSRDFNNGSFLKILKKVGGVIFIIFGSIILMIIELISFLFRFIYNSFLFLVSKIGFEK